MLTPTLLRSWSRTLIGLAVLAACSSSFASTGSPIAEHSLSGVQHAAWTPRDGAPASVMAIEQSLDGALWLGSRQGLYRFDGLHFDRIVAVDEDKWSPADIYALHTMPNGDLWIGTFASGAVLLHNGKATRFREGLPKSGVTQFIVDQRRGGLWASTTMGLARFDGTKFHTVGAEMGLPAGQSVTCVLDDEGNLLVRTSAPGLFVLRPGSLKFDYVEDGQTRYLPFAVDRQQRIWESTKDGIQLLTRPGFSVATRIPWSYPSFAPDIRFDHQGALWVTERGFGVARVRSSNESTQMEQAPVTETFHERDGLTSEQVMCNFVDRDGDVWVGTERGLDRFHVAALTRIDGPIGAAYLGTQPAPAGSAWIVAFTGGAWLRTAMGDVLPQPQLPRDVTRITAITSDLRGGLWISSTSVLGHLDTTLWKTVPALPETLRGTVTSMVSDHHEGLWAIVNGSSLVHWDGKQWTPEQSVGHLAATSLALDGTNNLLIGTKDGRIITLSPAHTVTSRTLPLGAVTALTVTGQHVWAGTDRGVVLIENNRQTVLPLRSSPELFRISGLIEANNGDLWLNTAIGVARVPADQWKAVIDKKTSTADAELYDAADGVEGIPLRTFLTPTASLLTDGRMIFSTQLGLYQIDASLIGNHTPPSTPYVAGLKADGTSIAPTSPFPSKVHTLEVSYGAACLRDVQRLTFRYRLKGFDRTWQYAGSRRDALYTNLSPGTYGFEAQSTFDGIHWSEASAPLSLTIPPSFTQRKSVRLLTLAALAFIAWYIVRLRVRRFHQMATLRLQAQLQERERIARDLHDTLLQSIQGVILRFGALVDNPTLDSTVRTKMHQSLALAEHVVTEGRDRVRDLRGESGHPELFQATLIETGTLLSAGTTTTFEWAVEGTPQTTQPVVADELILIVREAMHNAFQHAQAQRILLTIAFSNDVLRVDVADDGIGLPPDLRNLSRPGHWGIPGMQERATRIGARLHIHANQPRGVQITLTAPATIAYKESKASIKRSWLPALWHLVGAK